MWPNGIGLMPGDSRSAAAIPRAINCGTAAIGTETSCLIEAPSFDCTSLICSRNAHMLARSARLSANTALSTSPSANAASMAACNVPSGPPFMRDTSINAYQGEGPAVGS
jgi:hypothetical protein